MNQRHTLIAFLAVLTAIVGLSLIAAANSALNSTVMGSAITGLIAVAGTFRPRQQQDAAP